MKYTLFISFLVFLLGTLPFPVVAQVIDLITVDFEATPLFAEAKVLPGDAIGRTATVTNVSSETQDIEFTFENIIDGGLAEVMELAVTDDSVVYEFDTFETFFDGGPYSLGALAPGESRAYTFYAAFPPEAGNEYQLTQFEFDLVIGVPNGTRVSDGGGDGIADDGGSGTGGSRALEIFREAVRVVDGTGGAFVTWSSNMPASTYLVCSKVDGGSVSLSTEPPLFGYDFAFAERFDSNTRHGLVLDDLEPGEYECRPAGRRSEHTAYTVGNAVHFTIPAPPAGLVAGISTDAPAYSGPSLEELLAAALTSEPPIQPMVLGAGKGADGLTYDEFKAEMDQLNATKLATAAVTKTPTSTEPFSSVAAAAEAADYSTPEGVKENLSFSWWPWIVGVLVILIAVWLLARKVDRT